MLIRGRLQKKILWSGAGTGVDEEAIDWNWMMNLGLLQLFLAGGDSLQTSVKDTATCSKARYYNRGGPRIIRKPLRHDRFRSISTASGNPMAFNSPRLTPGGVSGLNQRGDFLPDLCRVQAVFILVLGGELLALALVLARSGLRPFDWTALGNASFMVQWIVLSSAALLCPLRPFLARRSLVLAGTVSYSLVLGVTLLASVVGQVLLRGAAPDWWDTLTHLLLAGIFGGIVLRYFFIQQQLLAQEEAESRARIEALQARIRPHFLFNSINSIASLIGSDPEKAERVVEDLADLFRASLAAPGLVPIEQELNLCRRYVNIEQLRLGKRLRVNWHVDACPEGCTIPSLLLQPIIENAIYHGIQPRIDGGLVDIRVSSDAEHVTISVRNPLARAGDSAARSGNQLALENVRHRLAAHYGARAVMWAAVEGDVYTTKISYPLTAKHKL